MNAERVHLFSLSRFREGAAASKPCSHIRKKSAYCTVSGRATAMRVYSWGICTFPFHYRAALPLVQYVQTCYRMSHLLSLVTDLMCQQNCFGEMIGVLLVNVRIPTYVSFLSTVHILSYFCPAPVSIMSNVCPMSHFCLISQFQCMYGPIFFKNCFKVVRF